MRPFRIIELKCPADAFEDGFRDAGSIAAFEANVILDTHSSEKGNLFTTEPWHATLAAEVR
jgi:hypothetical protein